MKRPVIFICDKDEEFRQELIQRFATSVEDYKLVGIENFEELYHALSAIKRKHINIFLIFSSDFFKKQETQAPELCKFIRKSLNMWQVIVYAPENETETVSKVFNGFNPIFIPQNDFTFYRIQNTVRNYINKFEYAKSKILFMASVIFFLISLSYVMLIEY